MFTGREEAKFVNLGIISVNYAYQGTAVMSEQQCTYLLYREARGSTLLRIVCRVQRVECYTAFVFSHSRLNVKYRNLFELYSSPVI